MKKYKMDQQRQQNNTLTIVLHSLIFIGATLIVLLLSLKPVASLGVAPSFYNIEDISSQDTLSLKLRILNTQQEDLFLMLEPKGDLSSQVSLETDTVRLDPSETEKEVSYSLTLPSNMEPGMNTLQIVIREVSLESTIESNTNVDAKVSVIQNVNVFVPYPDMHLTGELFATTTTISDPVIFTNHLMNRGSVEALVEGVIRIKGPMQNIIDEFSIEPTTLLPSKTKKIETFYNHLQEPGLYLAESILHYGKKTLVLRKDFVVGEKEILIKDLFVDSFNLGDIVQLNLLLENKWNIGFDNAYAEMIVLTSNGQVVQRFKSSPENIPAYGEKRMTAYWETERLTVGDYRMVVIMHFDQETAQEEFPLTLSMDEAEFIIPTGNVISQDNSKDDEGENGLGLSDRLTFFGILLVAILIVNIAILFYFKNMKKE